MLLDAFTELDLPTHAVDEIGIAVLSLIALIYLAVSWRKTGVEAITTQNNVLFAFFVLMLLFQIYGIVVEAGTNDFGNEIPVLIGIVLALVNRFT